MTAPVNLSSPSYLPTLLGTRLPGNSLLATLNATRVADPPPAPRTVSQTPTTGNQDLTAQGEAQGPQSINLVV